VEKSGTNMSEYSYQLQKSKKQMSEFSYWVQKSKICVNFILGAKEQNMCEFLYWVQKSKTCDLNFHIGCKQALLRNLSTDRVDFL
jgi:hypothetical protein